MVAAGGILLILGKKVKSIITYRRFFNQSKN